jgi:hypothetical protein
VSILKPEARLTVQQLIELLQKQNPTDLVCVETFTLPQHKVGRIWPLRGIEASHYTPDNKAEYTECVTLLGYGKTGENS